MSIYEALADCYNIKEEEKDDHPWYHNILQYVKNCEYPEQATENDKRTLRRLANEYVLDVEAASYTNIMKLAVNKFLKKEIIYWYRITIAEVYSQFRIKHHNSSPYRPKINIIICPLCLSNICHNLHQGNVFLIDLWNGGGFAHCSRDSFSLSFIKVELNLIEEKRLKAIHHGQMYQKRMMRAYDKKVHPRELHEGDLVLKKILPIQKNFRGKWMPNREEPYVVKKVFSRGALILTKMDGKNLLNPVNSDSVKKYFT
ncbi:RNA-directed DNA polymerase [Gossypium australe]|uniref:RNA-directed DNA polymerase n=1 Tax=Gossypium australe TaxID=47621 RepID=A0A5B6UYM4_9ROSI|nr:RNA-directed DNA polymerase [Gossypium australe]